MNSTNLIAVLLIVLCTGCSKKADVKPLEVTPAQLLPADNTVYSSEYAYNLNVIYFIPNDQVANDHYEERLSGVFTETQEFFNKWMRHWGYGDITFGLLKDETKSRVKIHTVYGSKPLRAYSNNMQAIVDEVEQYFKTNPGTKTSQHTMVMIPFNEKNKIGGAGGLHIPTRTVARYGFAIEKPVLKKEHVQTEDVDLELPSRERSKHDIEVRHTRDMLYELSHALGLLPHNKSLSHPLELNEAEFYYSLMGMKGRFIDELTMPTFLTYFDATILANSQLFSKKATAFYEKAISEINIISNIWDREKDVFTLSGDFKSSTPVSHVSFRLREKVDTVGNNSVIWTLLPLEGNKFVLRVTPWEILRYTKANDDDANANLEIIIHHTSGDFTSKSYSITYNNILWNGKFESN